MYHCDYIISIYLRLNMNLACDLLFLLIFLTDLINMFQETLHGTVMAEDSIERRRINAVARRRGKNLF